MAFTLKKIIKGIWLKPESSDPAENAEGSLWSNSVSNKIKSYIEGAVREVVTNDQSQTLTNKTIVAANNTITTAASGNLAATELNAALSELQSDIDTRALSSTVSAHTGASSGVHGVTGSVVGTSDSQALTNKTIVVANNTVTTAASGNLAATELNAALSELQSDIDTRAAGDSSSVDSEITLFNGTTGKSLKRATGTGFVKVSSGVMQTPSSTVSLTSEVSGALPIANGGTGQTSANAAFNALSPMTTGGDLIYGGASGAATRLANGTSGQVLTSNGGTSAPTWTTISGTVSATLTAADAATTYQTDLAGNVFSVWKNNPDTYVPLNLSVSVDIINAAFSTNMEFALVCYGSGSGNGVDFFKRCGNTFTRHSNIVAGTSYDGSVDIHKGGTYAVVGRNTTSPFYALLTRDRNTWSTSTPFTGGNPGSAVNWVKYNPDGTKLGMAVTSSPYVLFYSVTGSGSTYAKDTQPGTIPTGNAKCIAFSSDGYATVAHTTSPFQTTWYVDGPYTNISVSGGNPAGNGLACAWSPDNLYLAVLHNTAPYLTVYKKTGTGGSATLTKLSIPAISGTTTATNPDQRALAWHPYKNGNKMILTVGGATVPILELLEVDASTDTFTLISGAYNIISTDIGAASSATYSNDGEFLFVTSIGTGFNSDKHILFRGSTPPPINTRKNNY